MWCSWFAFLLLHRVPRIATVRVLHATAGVWCCVQKIESGHIPHTYVKKKCPLRRYLMSLRHYPNDSRVLASLLLTTSDVVHTRSSFQSRVLWWIILSVVVQTPILHVSEGRTPPKIIRSLLLFRWHWLLWCQFSTFCDSLYICILKKGWFALKQDAPTVMMLNPVKDARMRC